MVLVWGILLTILSLIGYFGQVITALWPKTAAKLGVAESEAEEDPTFYADLRAEAIRDTVILWTLPVAGILLILNNPLWAYFGLVGGGMYLYFAGRGIVVRRAMKRSDIRIGAPGNLKIAYIFLALWGSAAIITIIMAVAALRLT